MTVIDGILLLALIVSFASSTDTLGPKTYFRRLVPSPDTLFTFPNQYTAISVSIRHLNPSNATIIVFILSQAPSFIFGT